MITNKIQTIGAVAVSTDYVYDSINRLVSETKTAGGSSLSTIYYSYDLAGNRTAVIKNGSTNTYTLGIGNRLASWGTNGSAQYDIAGNTTNLVSNDAFQRSLSWDSRYRLKSVKSAESVEVSYTYDVSGRRTARIENGVTNLFVYNGNQIVADLDGDGNVLRTYTWGSGIDNLLALTTYSTTATNTYYPIKDHQNSILALVDGTGSVVETYQYDAYGNPTIYDASGSEILNQTSQIGNRYLFQGREYNSITHLYYFRARYYNPETATWLSKDPIGISAGLNLYTFCGNNPVMFVDPYGESWAGFWGGVGMIVGGATLAVATVLEDAATGGVGIFNDGVSFVVAAELIEGGMAVIVADRASEGVVDIIKETRRPSPATGEPDSIIRIPDGKGGYTDRDYDSDGRAKEDRDYGHDGAGDPHKHKWDWNKKPPRQPGTPIGGNFPSKCPLE